MWGVSLQSSGVESREPLQPHTSPVCPRAISECPDPPRQALLHILHPVLLNSQQHFVLPQPNLTRSAFLWKWVKNPLQNDPPPSPGYKKKHYFHHKCVNLIKYHFGFPQACTITSWGRQRSHLTNNSGENKPQTARISLKCYLSQSLEDDAHLQLQSLCYIYEIF